jgi:hypothetical protein
MWPGPAAEVTELKGRDERSASGLAIRRWSDPVGRAGFEPATDGL